MPAIALTALLLASLSFAKQPSAPNAVPAPLRDLEFGDINFLHTTDTHGWHGGHLQEASYSADWGDYVDFSHRLREQLESRGKDLIVVDTGDRIEGNGLYDSDNPKGLHTLKIFKKQDIDLICSGNHELYQRNSSEGEYYVTVPAYHNSYIASNLNITSPKTGKSEPLAPRFRKFKTRVQGVRVTAFGFIFNFTGNANNTQVRFVGDVVNESWFQDVLRDPDVDLFVVVAHAGAYSPELDTIYKAIRREHPFTPIQFFAGHEHIRAYKVFDLRAVALASGRYLETIGFQSIKGITGPNRVQPLVRFFRRYIDNNLFSFYHHTGLNESTFHSERGRKVSQQIEQARKDLKLDDVYGCAPQDYWMTRAAFPSSGSIYTLLNETILPEIVVDQERADKPRLILTNTGAIRFDIFKGPFTIDTTYIVSPFTSAFGYIKDIPLEVASQVVEKLNGSGRQVLAKDGGGNGKDEIYEEDYSDLGPLGQNHKYANEANEVYHHQHHMHSSMTHHEQMLVNNKPDLTPGYTTFDDDGAEGDDTIHSPIARYLIPNVMYSLVVPEDLTGTSSSSSSPSLSSSSSTKKTNLPQTVDLVYNEFLGKYITSILHNLTDSDYTHQQEIYMGGVSMTQLIESWISKNWKTNCSNSKKD